MNGWTIGGIGAALVVGYIIGRIHRRVSRRFNLTFTIKHESLDESEPAGSDPDTSGRIKHVPFEEDEHE